MSEFDGIYPASHAQESTETMRDRIAIKVMDRMLTEPEFYKYPSDGMTPAEYIAQNAYALADAMMKERMK